jgi:hypothetical protein
MQCDGEHVLRLHHMAGFAKAHAVEAYVACFHQRNGQTAVFYKPRINQPFIDTLGQLYPCFICAFNAARAAKGELGSIGFSGFGGRGGGRTASGARLGLYLSR